MTLERVKTPLALSAQPGMKPAEGEAVSRALIDELVSLLETLSPEEWGAVTACDPWTVKDVAVHLLGWSEALCSPRAFAAQARSGLKRRRRFANLLDAHNDGQVEAGRSMSTDEVLDRLRVALPRAAKLRRRAGASLHYVPAYASFLGGACNLGYLLTSIFPRDLIVHALDVRQATGRDAPVSEAGARIAMDMVRDWARRQDVDATIELSDPDAVYVARSGGRATIRATTAAMVHRLAGRTPSTKIEVSGDTASAERWLAAGCPV